MPFSTSTGKARFDRFTRQRDVEHGRRADDRAIDVRALDRVVEIREAVSSVKR
jgi:hypothetical protein